MIRMKKKGLIIKIILSIFFLGALFRLFYLGFMENGKYEDLLRAKTEIYINGLSAPRGRILDSKGRVIVDNKGIKTIMYNKIKGISTTEELEIAQKLNEFITINGKLIALKNYWLLLHNNGEELVTSEEKELVQERKLTSNDLLNLKYERITPEILESLTEEEKNIAYIYDAMNEGYIYQKKEILKNASDEVCAQVAEAYIPGITIEMSWERVYLYGDTMKTILGSIGPIMEEEKTDYLSEDYELTDVVGRSFLEKEYEPFLKGKKAKYKVNSDNTLTLVEEPQKGNDLVLSIDIEIQKKVEEILQEKILLGKKEYANTEYYKESYALISNPLDGSVIAMAGQRLNQDGSFSDLSALNISSSFTIGSAVKGATIAVGYKYNLIEMGKYITDGCIKLYAVPLKCSHKRLGRINDIDALAQSSNYFQFLIAIGLTGNKYVPNGPINANLEHFTIYRDMLSSFGLGVITKIDLPGEVSGLKGSRVADDLLLNLSIGQYDAYTPVEVLQYINSVATGKRMQLSLMHEVKNGEEVIIKHSPTILNDVDLDPIYLERIREGMAAVLSRGTGKGYVDVALNPAGKTGTSETFIDTNNDGTLDLATISSTFAGFFPKDNPKYSVVVITPNVSHHSGKTDYMYFAARRITNDITSYLNEISE